MMKLLFINFHFSIVIFFILNLITIILLGIIYYFLKNRLYTKDILSNHIDLNNTTETLFTDRKLMEQVEHELIILLVNNDFTINYSHILTHIKNKFNFNINEFLLVSFKLGALTKVYVNDPISLVEYAITLEKDFTKSTIESLKNHLKTLKLINETNFSKKHAQFQIDLEKELNLDKVSVLTNSAADILIDNWINAKEKINKN